MESPFSASTLFLGRAEGRGDNIFFFFGELLTLFGTHHSLPFATPS